MLLNPGAALLNGFLGEMADIFIDDFMHLGLDEVNWRCYNRSAEARAYLHEHTDPRLEEDDDGWKYVLRAYTKRLQQLVIGLSTTRGRAKKTTVWQEALDKYGPGNHGEWGPSAVIDPDLC
jgi:hypothetical protein